MRALRDCVENDGKTLQLLDFPEGRKRAIADSD